MTKTFTVSAEEALHADYQRLCFDRKTSISKELQKFMQSELDGSDKAFKDLQDRVTELETTVNDLVSNKDKEKAGGF